MNDKKIEELRYDEFAKNFMSGQEKPKYGYDWMPFYLRPPYQDYVEFIRFFTKESSNVLELGSGFGAYTGFLLEKSKLVVASDISQLSIRVLTEYYKNNNNLSCSVEDIEHLSFPDHSFDLIFASGVLSYGDNTLVLNEVYRCLRPGGLFIFVDSLNDSFVYRLNRFVKYLLGHRSLSTLKRMPTANLIKRYSNFFIKREVRYHGAFIWIYPILSFFLSDSIVSKIFRFIESTVNPISSAFKIVVVFEKPLDLPKPAT